MYRFFILAAEGIYKSQKVTIYIYTLASIGDIRIALVAVRAPAHIPSDTGRGLRLV